MTPENLIHLLDFIIEFCEDRLDFTEWHEGQVFTVTKSGDLSKPNKWRGVNLMNIGAKVFSSMMCKILFKRIKLHRCPVDMSLYVHSEVTGNVTFQDTVLAHARTELDMNTVDRS